MTPPALAAVAPFLSALPTGTPINVNTAPPEVLAAIVDNLGRGGAARRSSRPGAEAPTRPSPSSAPGCPTAPRLPATTALAVRSAYFYVTVEAKQGATLARGRALLRRNGGGRPTVVWQVVE